MAAASYQEIQSARQSLEQAGYSVEAHENGHLIVSDPVMRCGHGAHAGYLVPAGTRPVGIRSLREAVHFIHERQ